VSRRSDMVWCQLRFPAELEVELAEAWLRSAAARGRAGLWTPVQPLVFELRLETGAASWWAGMPSAEATALRRQMEDWLPGLAVLSEMAPQEAVAQQGSGLAVELGLHSKRRTLRAELQPEIARGLLDIGAGLRGKETVVVQWLVGGWLARSPVAPPGSGRADDSPMASAWGLLRGESAPVLDSEATLAARKKQSEQLFACVGRVAVHAATSGRRQRLVARVVGVYKVAQVPGASLDPRWLPSWWVRSRTARLVLPQLDPPAVLRADELAAVLGWPLGLSAEQAPEAKMPATRLLRPNANVCRPLVDDSVDESLVSGTEAKKRLRQRVVAQSAFPSVECNLVLDERSGLRHLHVLGPSGVGKSTLLSNLILQDIAAHRGVVVVDPKGDLVDDVLRRMPSDALDRVAVLDPTDRAPLGVNPLAGARRNGAGLAVEGLFGVLHSLWAESWGPRLGDVLHAGLLTLALEPGHSLVELPLLLTNPGFRRPLVALARSRDPLGLAGFWGWFDELSPEQAAQVLAPVMNKLRSFLLRPDLRAVLGQTEPRFDLSEIFGTRAIPGRALLVRLPRGELGAEAATLLGSLVVHQVWQASQARAGMRSGRRPPVFVYLDEFQDVLRLPLALGEALVQARGLGVGLVLAHQHLGQLSPTVRAAVLANAGSRVVFGLDHDDAVVMSKRSGDVLKPGDFTGLPAFEAYVDLVAGNQSSGFASARTVALGKAERSLGSVLSANRKRVGVDRRQTERRLRELVDSSTGAGGGESGGQSTTAAGGPSDESLGGFGTIPGNGDGGRS
jgi:hypothetical protein